MNHFQRAALLVVALFTTLALHASIGTGLQMQLGNPSGATVDPANQNRYLIQRAQYALDYNATTREPNWVSWDLTSTDTGSSGRSDFVVDTTLPAGFYQVLTTDYSGSGYDRGHMCPSGDRTVTTADNQFTFFMSNMVPQAPDNNQGVWASFETYCRTLAAAGNEVLITSGPSGYAGSTIASGVAIPGYVWKIAVVVPAGAGTAASRVTASTRVIAIKIPNIAGVRSNPWQQYITSAAQIEADTGYTFFSDLAPTIRAALRVVVDGQTATGAPVITTQPSGQSAPVGGNASFTVAATGDAPLTYQWYKNDIDPVAGATTASLALTNVQAADAATYTVVVTNAIGSATSNGAGLVLTGIGPSIVTSPVSRTVNAGSTMTFSVTASGSPTLTYQWRKGTTALTNGGNVSGVTTPSLVLTNVQSADAAATYNVVVTNSVNSATSANATLVVNAAAPTITTPPVATTVSAGNTATLSVVATGTAPLTYQWRKGGTDITGNTSATTSTLLLPNAQAADAANYDVVISNGVGTPATSAAVALTVSTVTSSQFSYTGGTYSQNFDTLPTAGTFTMAGAGPFAFNAAPFNLNGLAGWGIVKLSGSGANALFTFGTGSGNSGSVYSFGAASASDRALGALLSGTAGHAWGVTLVNTTGQTITQFTVGYNGEQWRYGGTTGTDRVIFEYQVGGTSLSTGTFTAAANLDFTSPVNGTTGGTTGALDGNVAANRTAITGTITGISWASGQTLVLRWRDSDVTGSDDGLAIDDFTFTTPVAAIPTVPSVASTTPANNAIGVAQNSAITIVFDQAVTVSGSWFTINSALRGAIPATVTISSDAKTFTLTPPNNFPDNDPVTVTIVASQVTEKLGGTLHPAANTSFTFTSAAPVAPTITTPPVAQTVLAGGTATFTVAASGTAPLSYQWRKNGTAITGNASATSPTLTLTNVQSGDATTYDVVVSNGVTPDATSNPVALTVTPVAPSIVTPPTAQSTTVGSNVTFTVVAGGSTPFTYQWRKGGTALVNGSTVSGATTASLTLTGVTLADAGNYDVVVTNGVNPAATSTAVALTVNTAPQNIITWDFATDTPTSGLPAELSGAQVTQGNNNGTTALITAVSVSSGYTGASGTNNAGAAARTGALVQSSGGSAYFELTLTPATGQQIRFLTLGFGARSTSTGPQAYAVYTSADNYAAPLATGTLANNSVWTLVTPQFTPLTVPVGTALTLRIYGYNGTGTASASTANWRIDDLKVGVTVPLTAPVITSQPQSQTTTLAQSVTFSVTTGPSSATPTYQWRKTGTPISGATNSSLVINSVQPESAAAYDVVVSNSAGSTTSSAASLSLSKILATLSLANLAQTYSGSPLAVSATSNPPGPTIAITYNGSTTPPTDAGTYAVNAAIDSPYYSGTATGTLVVAKAAQTVAFGTLPAAPAVGTAFGVTATATSGLPVTFAVASGNATLSGSNVTLSDTAVVTLRALQAGNTNYNAASADITVTGIAAPPVKRDQTIAFAAPAGRTTADAPFALAATASSGLAVAFELVSGPAVLAGSSVSLTGATGTVVIRATQAGNATFNAAPAVERSFTVAIRTFAGVYFGTLSGGRTFALYVADDRTGTFLAYAPASRTAYLSRTVTVDANGRFTLVASTTGGTQPNASAASVTGAPPNAAAVDDLVIEGTIAGNGTITGASTVGTPLTLSGEKSPDTGPAAATAGFYLAGAANSPAQTFAVVSPAGQVLIVTQSGSTVDGGSGTLDANGKVTVTTAAQQTISATISADNAALAATVTAANGSTTTFSGFAGNSPASSAQRLVNLSTRTTAGTGDQVAIVGFVITGTESKSVLLRAVGPSLRTFGVTTALGAPRLDLVRSGTTAPIATNTGWSTSGNSAEIIAAAARSGAFPLAAGSADSVLLATLAPGSYSAVVTASDGRAGVGLVEVYDLTSGPVAQRLANLSTRAAVGTGDNTLIAGLVVSGNAPKRLLLRAAGPALAQFGVSGVLARPQLSVFSGATAIVNNAGWSTSPDAAAIAEAASRTGAFAFGATSADAALIVNLAPGAYTAQVTGVGNTTGITLIEVYELP